MINMKTFRINDEYEVVCRFEKTRSGFRHLAHLMRNGSEVDSAKCCYQNRTWEAFEFESVIEKMLSKTDIISKEEQERFLARLRGEDLERVNDMFGTLRAVAAMGEVMFSEKKDQNGFKKRMVEASLGEGISFPDDWNELSEEEKQKRLDKAMSVTA